MIEHFICRPIIGTATLADRPGHMQQFAILGYEIFWFLQTAQMMIFHYWQFVLLQHSFTRKQIHAIEQC